MRDLNRVLLRGTVTHTYWDRGGEQFHFHLAVSYSWPGGLAASAHCVIRKGSLLPVVHRLGVSARAEVTGHLENLHDGERSQTVVDVEKVKALKKEKKHV